MLTWAERKRRRELRRALDTMPNAHLSDPGLTTEEAEEEASRYFREREQIEYEMWQIETYELLRAADRQGINVDREYSREGLPFGFQFLPSEARNTLRRAIPDERRATWAHWIGVLMPPLSFLVGLAGVLVALVSVFNSCV